MLYLPTYRTWSKRKYSTGGDGGVRFPASLPPPSLSLSLSVHVPPQDEARRQELFPFCGFLPQTNEVLYARVVSRLKGVSAIAFGFLFWLVVPSYTAVVVLWAALKFFTVGWVSFVTKLNGFSRQTSLYSYGKERRGRTGRWVTASGPSQLRPTTHFFFPCGKIFIIFEASPVWTVLRKTCGRAAEVYCSDILAHPRVASINSRIERLAHTLLCSVVAVTNPSVLSRCAVVIVIVWNYGDLLTPVISLTFLGTEYGRLEEQISRLPIGPCTVPKRAEYAYEYSYTV